MVERAQALKPNDLDFILTLCPWMKDSVSPDLLPPQH